MKRIVLLSDGTGNSSAKAEKTNVWRMFQAIDQSLGAQLVMYDDGVGTSSNKYLAAVGGAFGWGLQRNVIDLYKFVCKNYQPGDEIYAFGFSRGAYTIRVLAALILNAGLVEFRSEEELQKRARVAFANLRDECFPVTQNGKFEKVLRLGSPVYWLRKLRKALTKTPPPPRVPADEMRIRFLGLWDTVSAYGMPIEEFKPAVNYLVWPMLFDNLKLHPNVQRACHALSLDDERTTFHPIVFDETAEAEMAKSGIVQPGRLTQIWFAGVHANVGGGYPEDQLSLVSLDWMMSQAAHEGLVLLPACRRLVSEEKSTYARLYDARSGFGAFYRYQPRQIREHHATDGKPILPVIHGSVIMRMAFGSDRYAPLPLPKEFWVLAPDGSLIYMDGTSTARDTSGLRQGSDKPQILNDEGTAINERMDKLHAAIRSLSSPRSDVIELVQDTVWWRRVIYFATLLFAVLLAIFPWCVDYDMAYQHNVEVARMEAIARSLLALLEQVGGTLLPDSLSRWLFALKLAPVPFLTLLVLFLASLHFGGVLKQRIADRSMSAWHKEMIDDYLDWMLKHEAWTKKMGALIGLIGLAIIAWFAVLPAKTDARVLPIGAACTLYGAWRLTRTATVTKKIQQNPDTLPRTFSLQFANNIRQSKPLFAVYDWTRRKFIPLILGILLITGIFEGANRVLFDVFSAAGTFCKVGETPETQRNALFQTTSMCWDTGYSIKRNRLYRITLEDAGKTWADDSIPAGMGGLTGTWVQNAGILLRRRWADKWFLPIARVNSLGNEEYPLSPQVPVEALTPSANDGRVPPTPDPDSVAGRKLVAYLTPRSDGPLFLYVNDAVLIIPGLTDWFYSNNHGTARVKVEEVLPPAPGGCHEGCKP